jgi:hypothetical protein
LSQQRFAYKYFSDFAKHLNPDGVVKLGNENSFQIANFPEKLNYSSVRSKVLQLFFLKKIGKGQIQTNENYKVQFIFGNKDKTPGNTLLRFDSDFEKDSSKRTVDHFIKNSDTQVLSKYFIDEELVRLYNENKVNEFIRQREFLIMEQEKEFVERMGVDYGIFIF